MAGGARATPSSTPALRRSELAGRGIERAKRGNTLDPLTLNLFYATDFWDRLERQIVPALRAGMVALVDRYVFSLIARARRARRRRSWIDRTSTSSPSCPTSWSTWTSTSAHLVPRVLSSTGFDYWESGQDFLRGQDVYQEFVEYQKRLLTEFRRLAEREHFAVVDGRRHVADVFRSLSGLIEPCSAGCATCRLATARCTQASARSNRGVRNQRR